MNWVSIYNVKDKIGSRCCPNCSYEFEERTIYFIEINFCKKCNTEIGFINVRPYHNYLYTIDLMKAPSVFRVIIDHLSKKNNKDAYNELKELVLLFSQHQDESPQVK